MNFKGARHFGWLYQCVTGATGTGSLGWLSKNCDENLLIHKILKSLTKVCACVDPCRNFWTTILYLTRGLGGVRPGLVVAVQEAQHACMYALLPTCHTVHHRCAKHCNSHVHSKTWKFLVWSLVCSDKHCLMC